MKSASKRPPIFDIENSEKKFFPFWTLLVVLHLKLENLDELKASKRLSRLNKFQGRFRGKQLQCFVGKISHADRKHFKFLTILCSFLEFLSNFMAYNRSKKPQRMKPVSNNVSESIPTTKIPKNLKQQISASFCSTHEDFL